MCWFHIPPLSKCCQGHMGFWQIPPSSSQEYLGSKWTVETEAYPKTWQLVQKQSYYPLWKKFLAPKHSDKSWNFRKIISEHISAYISAYISLFELADIISFSRAPMSSRSPIWNFYSLTCMEGFVQSITLRTIIIYLEGATDVYMTQLIRLESYLPLLIAIEKPTQLVNHQNYLMPSTNYYIPYGKSCHCTNELKAVNETFQRTSDHVSVLAHSNSFTFLSLSGLLDCVWMFCLVDWFGFGVDGWEGRSRGLGETAQSCGSW